MSGLVRSARTALGWRRAGSINVPAASLPTPTTSQTSTAILLLLLEEA